LNYLIIAKFINSTASTEADAIRERLDEISSPHEENIALTERLL